MDNTGDIIYIDSSIDMLELSAKWPQFDYKSVDEEQGLAYCLSQKKGKLGILTLGEKELFLNLDFASGEIKRRRKFMSPKKEPMLKAIGKLEVDDYIVDGTAGLGRESFLLMSFGYQVRAVERSPYLWILLQEALDEILKSKGIDKDKQRLSFHCGDSLDMIEKLAWEPKVLYLDPMFPGSKKSALVKKPMQVLQKMELKSEAAEDLLKKALTLNVGKIVFKRPKEAPILDTQACREYYENDTVRFEVYEPN